MKFNSIPESEPLYKIIQSRTIDLSKIKDKEERKYWREQKRINKIPEIFEQKYRKICVLHNLKLTLDNLIQILYCLKVTDM